MKIENLKKIALGRNVLLKESVEDDVTIYELDWLRIEPTDDPIRVRGLMDRPHPTARQWAILGVKHYHGDRDNPPDWDTYEITRADSLDLAVQEGLIILAKHEIEQAFVSYSEEEMEQSFRDFDDSEYYS